MIKKYVLCYLTGLCFLSAFANAAIYKYVDANGNTVYSNIPIGKIKPVKLPNLSVYSAEHRNNKGKKLDNSTTRSHPKRKSSPSATSNNDSNSYTNINGRTQEDRDSLRRKILRQELDNERKALDDAEQTLTDERKSIKDPDKLKKFQDTVTERKKNISALERELGNKK